MNHPLPRAQRARIELAGIGKTYERRGGGEVQALLDVSLSIAVGEFVFVVGANGSGKSTLLRLISGALMPTAGRISWFDNGRSLDWTRQPRSLRAERIATVHQDPGQGTCGSLTVAENLRLATLGAGVPSPIPRRIPHIDRERFRAALFEVGLADHLEAKASELSQGQRQLLAIQLATLRRPAILLLDEHTASLDRANSARCMEATDRIARAGDTAVLAVCHNLQIVQQYGTRLLVLDGGRVTADIGRQEKQRLSLLDLVRICGFA